MAATAVDPVGLRPKWRRSGQIEIDRVAQQRWRSEPCRRATDTTPKTAFGHKKNPAFCLQELLTLEIANSINHLLAISGLRCSVRTTLTLQPTRAGAVARPGRILAPFPGLEP